METPGSTAQVRNVGDRVSSAAPMGDLRLSEREKERERSKEG